KVVDYLRAAVSEYLATPVPADAVVWRYAGVRPLYDDGATSATAATRDYVLSRGEGTGAPVLHVFGGKITTYRRLAEAAMKKLTDALPRVGRAWTAGKPLPGGAFPVDGVPGLVAQLRAAHPFLTDRWALRLVRGYGTEAAEMLAGARTAPNLGEAFGATLTAREVDWLMDREWARTAEDVLWRRTKLGLRVTPGETARLSAYMGARRREKTAA
ncbi:MAG: glycerol-3-phosphate dehydrogenase C-terminal domain-containing protein, partial [Pseudomonadota bacterium]